MEYKNPFEDPEEKLWDQKIKDYKIPERKETLEEKVPNLEGYIYVPSIKLYVAKEKSLHGLSWYKTHEELHKKGLQMLTIRQFIDFALYLKQNPNIQDAKKILDEILAKREPGIGEWLDAKFSKKAKYKKFGKRARLSTKERYISYNHRTAKGRLVAQNKEPLEKCLMEDYNFYLIDLKSCNKQGLPTKKGNDIQYYYPRPGCVAGCYVSLHCDWIADSYPSTGVRAARKVENKMTGKGGIKVWK